MRVKKNHAEQPVVWRESHASKEEEVAAYERLRSRALGTAEEGGSHGWALLLSRGMVAWLRAFWSYAPLGSTAASSNPTTSLQQATGLSSEITQILTNMVFAIRSLKT